MAFAATIILFVSCGASVRGYVLSHRGDTEVLIPPGVTLPKQGTLEVKFLNARKAPFPSAGCELDRDPISIRWQGGTAYVRVKSDSQLLGFGQSRVNEQPVPLDPRGNVAGRPIPLDPLQYINEFRAELIGLEAKGCLHAGESEALAANIAEKLPFQPFIAYLLRFGAFDLNEFIDLTPDFRLRVVYPTYSENDSGGKQIKGVETVYYEIVSDQNDGRVKISPLVREDSSRNDGTPQGAAKHASPFPSSSAYFRLFLKKGMSSKDPITVAIVLSSADRKHLDDATTALDAATEPSCRAILSSSANCVLFPPLTGVNAEIRVKANGKDAYTELGARVDQLIHELGTDDIPRSVQVRRLFDKRLVPIKADTNNKELLALVLMPGDVVNYR